MSQPLIKQHYSSITHLHYSQQEPSQCQNILSDTLPKEQNDHPIHEANSSWTTCLCSSILHPWRIHFFTPSISLASVQTIIRGIDDGILSRDIWIETQTNQRKKMTDTAEFTANKKETHMGVSKGVKTRYEFCHLEQTIITP